MLILERKITIILLWVLGIIVIISKFKYHPDEAVIALIFLLFILTLVTIGHFQIIHRKKNKK